MININHFRKHIKSKSDFLSKEEDMLEESSLCNELQPQNKHSNINFKDQPNLNRVESGHSEKNSQLHLKWNFNNDDQNWKNIKKKPSLLITDKKSDCEQITSKVGSEIESMLHRNPKTSKRKKTLKKSLYANKEELQMPLLQGWKREVVTRNISNKSGKRIDIYYFSPSGIKLRSSKELEKYLIEKNSSFSPKHFSFSQVSIGLSEPFEVHRYANFNRRPEVKSKPASKKEAKHVKTKMSNFGFDDTQAFIEAKTTDRDQTSEKEIVYVEELYEEESPDSNHSLPDPMQSGSSPFGHHDPQTQFSTIDERQKTDRALGDDDSDPPKRPMMPVFQLQYENTQETLKEEASQNFKDSAPELLSAAKPTPTKSPPRLRVRSLTELCGTSEDTAASPPNPFLNNDSLSRDPSLCAALSTQAVDAQIPTFVHSNIQTSNMETLSSRPCVIIKSTPQSNPFTFFQTPIEKPTYHLSNSACLINQPSAKSPANIKSKILYYLNKPTVYNKLHDPTKSPINKINHSKKFEVIQCPITTETPLPNNILNFNNLLSASQTDGGLKMMTPQQINWQELLLKTVGKSALDRRRSESIRDNSFLPYVKINQRQTNPSKEPRSEFLPSVAGSDTISEKEWIDMDDEP